MGNQWSVALFIENGEIANFNGSLIYSVRIIDPLSKGLVAGALGGLEVRHKFKLQYLWF